MNVLENLKYSRSHEWVEEVDETTVRVGLTDFAQHELGDLVFVNLPEVGDTVTVKEAFADVERVKAVSDVYSPVTCAPMYPVTGVISAVNEDILDSPEMINEAPYEAWLIEVKEVSEREELVDSAAYE